MAMEFISKRHNLKLGSSISSRSIRARALLALVIK
jgi:hypothetical protein